MCRALRGTLAGESRREQRGESSGGAGRLRGSNVSHCGCLNGAPARTSAPEGQTRGEGGTAMTVIATVTECLLRARHCLQNFQGVSHNPTYNPM